MKILSSIHDPEAIYLPLINELKEHLKQLLHNPIIAVTSATNPQIVEVLKEIGFEITEGGLYGESRISVVQAAIKSDFNLFFYCDLDKLLHWIKFEKDEFAQLLNMQLSCDFLILSRTQKAWDTYPESWKQTESIANYLSSKVFGCEIDVYTGDVIFNRKSAEIIASQAQEKNWGSCFEFPLLAFKSGLKVDSQEVNGLSWEDPDKSQAQIEKAGGIEKWKELYFDSIDEWQKRTKSLVEQVEIIKKFLNSK